MSAYRYLIFVGQLILVAVFGSVILYLLNPVLPMLRTVSSSQASATGVSWFSEFVGLIPIVMLFLVVFSLLYGIVVRRGRIHG